MYFADTDADIPEEPPGRNETAESEFSADMSGIRMSKEIVDAVADVHSESLGDAVDEQLGHLGYLNLGSALRAGDIGEMMRLSGNKLAVQGLKTAGGLSSAVASFVETTWFAYHYPTWGGLLSWGPWAAWFGPPAYLTGAVVNGALLAAALPIQRLTGGLKKKWDRSKQERLMEASLPVAYATATADDVVTIEELRFLKDLVREAPHDGELDPGEALENMRTMDNPRSYAMKRIRELHDSSIQSWQVGQESVLRFGVLMAHADGEFDDRELSFLRRVGQAMGYERDETNEHIEEIERTYLRRQWLANASMRGMFHIAESLSGEMKDEAMKVLDAFLISQVPAESDRRELVSALNNSEDASPLIESSRIRREEPLVESNSMMDTVAFWSESDPYEDDIGLVVESICDFFVTIESLADGDLDYAARETLYEIAEMYDYSVDEIQSELEEVRKVKEEAEREAEQAREDTKGAECPNCGTEGNFEMSTSRWAGRNEYQCSRCEMKLFQCRTWGCSNLVRVGDLHHEQLCEECWPMS
jgi:tellurite resistance protein/predicted RNA-binding Zn-ribbon protein involved in translation (DUF1610 family)